MAANLVQRLRTCSVAERRAVAMELAQLAQTGNDEAVQELIQVADGGKHTPAVYGRKHWYNLSKTILEPESWEYNLDNQLAAIEALGYSRNPMALSFLGKLYSPIQEIIDGPKVDIEYAPQMVEEARMQIEEFQFPNAKGELKARLDYQVELTLPQGDKDVYDVLARRDESEIQGELQDIFSTEPHATIQRVIRELEESKGERVIIFTGGPSSYAIDTPAKMEIRAKHSPQAFLRKTVQLS